MSIIGIFFFLPVFVLKNRLELRLLVSTNKCPIRILVPISSRENRWGPDAGRDGYYTMTDRWFDEYTYQIVVNRKYLPKEVLEAYEQEPIVLKPWDPMGSLA